MKIPVNSAYLIKRYKRFLADVKLTSGEIRTIHCANTGAMTGCANANDKIWYSTATNPKRKYPNSWEVTITQQDHWICVNTLRANQLVEEALINNTITELLDYSSIRREVSYGNEKSKVDFLLQSDNKPDTYVEVKSVTLLDSHGNENIKTDKPIGQGYFPDTVSIRGQKHLRELSTLKQQGHRTVLLFAILHSGITSVKAAKHIDPQYAKLLAEATALGVEVLVYKTDFNLTEDILTMSLTQKCPY